jgi:hypothetical protein
VKRLILTLAIAALVLPSSALGKGPSAVAIDGPGAGGGGITLNGSEGGGQLMTMAEQAGFFAAAFGQEPSPLLARRPQGDLGPRYVVTYTVPGGTSGTFTIRQEIYPYASPGPVTYMRPGQPVFEMKTRGGWLQAGPELKKTLVSAGLPASAPPALPAGSSPAKHSNAGAEGSSFPTTAAVSVLVVVLLLVGAAALLLRRRARPAAA